MTGMLSQSMGSSMAFMVTSMKSLLTLVSYQGQLVLNKWNKAVNIAEFTALLQTSNLGNQLTVIKIRGDGMSYFCDINSSSSNPAMEQFLYAQQARVAFATQGTGFDPRSETTSLSSIYYSNPLTQFPPQSWLIYFKKEKTQNVTFGKYLFIILHDNLGIINGFISSSSHPTTLSFQKLHYSTQCQSKYSFNIFFVMTCKQLTNYPIIYDLFLVMHDTYSSQMPTCKSQTIVPYKYQIYIFCDVEIFRYDKRNQRSKILIFFRLAASKD